MNIDKEFVLEFVNRLRGTSLVRVGGGIALIGAVALTSIVQYLVIAIFESAGVQIRIPDTPFWLGLCLVMLGLLAAVLGAYWQRPSVPAGPNPHDVRLLRRYQEIVATQDLQFLRVHDFIYSHPYIHTDCCFELDRWEGVRYEFCDVHVQKHFAVVRQTATRLADLLATNTSPHHSHGHGTVHPVGSSRDNMSERTEAAVKQLNEAATAFVDAASQFERAARVRIPLEPQTINPRDGIATA